ncbi:hypothetical protein [Rhodococcus tibetensis]|uniref:Uncharacterized protein n=1 Tax=Rhodococcus tibetensis TaxID=2965064 RepID=A0ABT1QC82_9NOCA|nr:hypothetical protein [Rhodococcus sp. FXJ9.536]MCQ4119889.1 hypothetical protein [Rhodococcus sp. FXJ9.536]
MAILDNGGTEPWSIANHLSADLWLVLARANSKKGKEPKDHPAREKQMKKRTAKKASTKRTAYERAKARNARRIAGTKT